MRRAQDSTGRLRRRPPGQCYDSGSYRRAIQRGCDAAFPPPPELRQIEGETKHEWIRRLTQEQRNALGAWQKSHRWHPHQLRHNFATNIRRDFGPDAANILLGHSTMSATQIYAAIDEEKAQQIIARVG
jgi:integrase